MAITINGDGDELVRQPTRRKHAVCVIIRTLYITN